MKICFTLEGIYRSPVCGYKIVYEYANRFAGGHDVIILFLNDSKFKSLHIPESIRKILVNVYTAIMPRWYKLDKNIRKISNQKKGFEKLIYDVDIFIVTSLSGINVARDLMKESKIWNFMQGYDFSYQRNLEKVRSLKITNIVIPNWLKEIADQNTKEPSILISNPIDTNIYNCIESRNKYKVGLMYHKASCKGFKFAYEALLILKQKFP